MSRISPSSISGPAWIAVGLTLLLLAAQFPATPVVTAMAIIALGTTEAVVTRFRHSPAAASFIALHGTTYLLLYVLFVAARLRVPATAQAPAVGTLALLDVAASAFFMALALRRILHSLRESLLSRP